MMKIEKDDWLIAINPEINDLSSIDMVFFHFKWKNGIVQIVKNRTSFRRCGWIQWLNCKMEIKWSCRVHRSTARNWPHSFTTGESHPTIIHRPIGNWTRNSKIAITVVFPFCKTCKRQKKRAILSHDSPAAPNNKYCRQSTWIDTKYFSDLVYWYKMHGSKSFTLKVDVFLWKSFFLRLVFQ